MPQEPATTELFNQALAQLQQKNWDASITLYRQLLDQGRESLTPAQASVVYHNMSGIAAEKADLLMAYTWSKKAVFLDSSNSAARAAFQQYSTQFQIPSIPHQISNFDNFAGLIDRVSLDVWLGFSLVFVLLMIWLLAKKWIVQKKNRLSGIFTPASAWPVYLTGFFALLFVVVTYFSYNQSKIAHGILISERARIQTAPGENKPVIYEAPPGLDVEVLKEDGGYYQVRSAGAFSGWVSKEHVELLSLNFEQRP